MSKKKPILNCILLLLMLMGLDTSYASMTHRLILNNPGGDMVLFCSIYSGIWNKPTKQCQELTFQTSQFTLFSPKKNVQSLYINPQSILLPKQNCLSLNIYDPLTGNDYTDDILITKDRLIPEEYIIK
jgi:hypothetical protein